MEKGNWDTARNLSSRKKYSQWVEINSTSLINNIHQFRRLIGNEKKLLAMVKANAYGHGIFEVSSIVLKNGADWLGVNSVEEGIFLREKGFDCPILVVGYVPLKSLTEAVTHDLRLTVYNEETINRLGKICREQRKKALLHIKVETGTYRQGIIEDNLVRFIQGIKFFPELVIEGISSHFANIEDTTNHSYAKFQLKNWKRILHNLEEINIKVPMKHMSCTASALLFAQTYFDMVRIGIGMYGLWPSKETYVSCLLKKHRSVSLKPVLSWKTRIAQIKKVSPSSFIGYGCTYKTTRETLLAVIPVGYYDGYSRSLSNSSYVLINGKRAPLRGRVAMDFIVVDVSDIPGISLEDEVVLIGEDGGESVSADDLASWVGSINYEIVSRINPNIPRIVV